ncbi:MAG: hypothetical protein HYT88_05195 [Candidatus Omnitrophica bacterium]|nr:hypothetical protein [Candidatus Omnitrophota bacterium]MBI2174042.1 hypothetical protein [Candidatus Omnitrophota bacterium]
MEIVHKAIRLAILVLLGLVPALILLGHWRFAAGLGCGLAWAIANIWAIGLLVNSALGPTPARFWKMLALWCIKLPILYGIAAVLVVSAKVSPIGFLLGFSLWFVLLMAVAFRSVLVSR